LHDRQLRPCGSIDLMWPLLPALLLGASAGCA
jgi:hypothetical protein